MRLTKKLFGIAAIIAVIVSLALPLTGCPTDNGVGSIGGSGGLTTGIILIEMVLIPASETLNKFYISKYEVTQELYQAVMGSNPSYYRSAVTGESGTPGKLPAERVNWYDALVFCNKLSIIEDLSPAYSINGSTDPSVWGTVPSNKSEELWDAVEVVSSSNGYRLPTQAQWMHACQTVQTISDNTDTGWYAENSGDKTHQVGLKLANDLYDMHGNVWEWCWDEYYDYYYSYSKVRIMCGGSYASIAASLGSWFFNPPYGRAANIGFRFVRPYFEK